MRTTGIPTASCTACGHRFECATHGQARVPIPGDVSICLECGHVMLFAADMTVRDPTFEESQALATDETVKRIRRHFAKGAKR